MALDLRLSKAINLSRTDKANHGTTPTVTKNNQQTTVLSTKDSANKNLASLQLGLLVSELRRRKFPVCTKLKSGQISAQRKITNHVPEIGRTNFFTKNLTGRFVRKGRPANVEVMKKLQHHVEKRRFIIIL